jgi:hypothetical protein
VVERLEYMETAEQDIDFLIAVDDTNLKRLKKDWK